MGRRGTVWTKLMDDRLRDAYASRRGSGELQALQDDLRLHKQTIRKRAKELGLNWEEPVAPAGLLEVARTEHRAHLSREEILFRHRTPGWLLTPEKKAVENPANPRLLPCPTFRT